MTKLSIKVLKNQSPFTNPKGLVVSNTFQVTGLTYGVFSIGGGDYNGGFANLSNVTNPIYQSIIAQSCTLKNMIISLCRNDATYQTLTGFNQNFVIYKNGVSVYSVVLDGVTTNIFTYQDLDLDFLTGDTIGFSLDNTMASASTLITLHTYFRNAGT
jgi:hypothetical protein